MNPPNIRVPVAADLWPYVLRQNIPGEHYGRTIARILESAEAAGLDAAPPRPIKHDRPWTPEEDALILNGEHTTENGRTEFTYTAKELAHMLNRSKPAIDTRRSRLRKEPTE